MIPPLTHAPEFRRDPVTGRWVIVAPERSQRPMALEGAEPRHRVGNDARPCPFCTGQEHDTPNEVFAFRAAGTAPNGPGWQLRVVPNMYPAVRVIADPSPQKDPSPGPSPKRGGEKEFIASPLRGGGWGEGSSLFQSLLGSGRHEVVIESPGHVANPALLPEDLFRDVFIAYRQRLIAHAADPAMQYVSVFKNVGAEAGASLGHCHSQLIAMPLVPDLIQQELDGSSIHFTRTGRCVFCDIVKHELADGSRIVAESPNLIAVAAYAGRFSHETWVLPKRHESRFEAITEELAAELAGLMKRLVRALDVVLAEPAYNWFLHAAPLRSPDLPHYHWHFEVMPRTSRPAGHEWGTGCFINAVAPETAASELRAAMS